jgi:phosphoglycolate phosphatase
MIAVHKTLESMFGEMPAPEMQVHGRTDNGIMSDVFELIAKDYQDFRETFDKLYWETLPEVLCSTNGSLLPGVLALLETLEREPDIALGILTGNAKTPAEIKLSHFGIANFFECGGYGDDHPCRNDVAAIAVNAARSHAPANFDEGRVWVIGDTVNDIICARSVGAKVIAVETGGGSTADLANAGPDVLLTDLSVQDDFVAAIREI